MYQNRVITDSVGAGRGLGGPPALSEGMEDGLGTSSDDLSTLLSATQFHAAQTAYEAA